MEQQIIEEHAIDALLGRLVDPFLRQAPTSTNDDDERLALQLEAVAWLYNHSIRDVYTTLVSYTGEDFCKKLSILRSSLSQCLSEGQGCMNRVVRACDTVVPSVDGEQSVSRVAVLLLSSSRKDCLIVRSLVTKMVWSLVEVDVGNGDGNDVLDAGLDAVHKHTGIDRDSLIVDTTFRDVHCMNHATRVYTMICKGSDVEIKSSSSIEEALWISLEELRSKAEAPLLETSGWGVNTAEGIDYFRIQPLLPPYSSGKEIELQTKSETTDISCDEEKRPEAVELQQVALLKQNEEISDTAKDGMEMISWSNQSPDPQDLPSSPTNPSPAVTQPRKPRHRWTPSRNHLSILERLFKQGTGTPNKQRIKEIATDLVQYGEISEANVYNWFQNRKAKEKKLMSQSGSAHLRHDGEAEIEAVAPREKRRRMDIDEIINPRPSRLSQELEGAKSTVKTEADVDLDEQNAVTEEGSRDNICATNLEGKERRRSFSETDAKRTKTDENCDEEEVDLLLKLKDPVQDLDELCLRGGLPIPFYKVQSTPHKSTQYLYTATVQICTLRNERSAVGTPSVDYNEAKVSAASRMLGRLYLERSRLYSNA